MNPCPRLQGRKGIDPLPGHIDDGCCWTCGSLDPDEFMRRLESGDVKLVPTDKDYKVYVRNDGGQPFRQTYGENYTEKAACGHEEKNHRWVCREVLETKFYFDHLNHEQMVRFVDLMNEKKLKIGYPGHFYRRPYFIGPVEVPAAAI